MPEIACYSLSNLSPREIHMASTSVYLFIATILATSAFAVADPTTQPTTQPMADGTTVGPALRFTMKSLGGKDINLSQYQGKVILMVNTASRCGHTPQYGPLEALYKKYTDQGFVILGFPSNDFGKQEPGTDVQISEFCTRNYGVTFDMFSKVDVKGDNMCDLYKFLTSPATDKPFDGDINWNFEKFLIDRSGNVVARFSPGTQPDSPQVVSAIEAQLAIKP
jgi:glutathione peroxidase